MGQSCKISPVLYHYYQIGRLLIILTACCLLCCCHAFNSQISRPWETTASRNNDNNDNDIVPSSSSHENPETTATTTLDQSTIMLLLDDGYHRMSRIRRFHQAIKRKIISTYDIWIGHPSANNNVTATSTNPSTHAVHYNTLRDDIIIIGMEDYLINENENLFDEILSSFPSHDDGSDILIIGLNDSFKKRSNNGLHLEPDGSRLMDSAMEVVNVTNTLADIAHRLSLNTRSKIAIDRQQTIPKLKAVLAPPILPSRIAFQ